MPKGLINLGLVIKGGIFLQHWNKLSLQKTRAALERFLKSYCSGNLQWNFLIHMKDLY